MEMIHTFFFPIRFNVGLFNLIRIRITLYDEDNETLIEPILKLFD